MKHEDQIKYSIEIPQRASRRNQTYRMQQEELRKQKALDRVYWFLFWCVVIGLGVPCLLVELFKYLRP
jgi:hypothetical protein